MKLPDFPINESLASVGKQLQEKGRLVLTAPPGAGKTTIVPLFLLEEPWLKDRRILILQPRRIAALNSARRMAALHGSPLGETVGYQVRFDRCTGPRTRIEVLTEGLLTRKIQRDPFLEGVGMVVFDEFHERSISADLGLGMVKEVLETVRPDLRVLVMSATMEAGPVSRFLGDCPIIEGKGFLHPVEIVHRGEFNLRDPISPVVRAVRESLAADRARGDILVFLPGAGEIMRTRRILEEAGVGAEALVVPLFGGLPLHEQDMALLPQKKRKVILSTNLAETSLTVEGVTTVIDSGLCRQTRLDQATGMGNLVLERISRASAAQRAGRAGRVRPGMAIRLWSETDHLSMASETVPEILRSDVAGAMLEVIAWGKDDPGKFGWFQPPPPGAVASAMALLRSLGAIEESGCLSPLGKDMVEVPAQPRVSAMLIQAAKDGHFRQGARLAALLSETETVRKAAGGAAKMMVGPSDLLPFLDLLEGTGPDDDWSGAEPAADGRSLKFIRRVAEQFEGIARRLKGSSSSRRGSPPSHQLLKIVLRGFPDRVCRKRAVSGEDPSFLMVGGRGMVLARDSVVRNSEYLVAVNSEASGFGPGNDGLIRWASSIEPEWLQEMFPGSIRTGREVYFDREREAVVARRRNFYLDLKLDEVQEPLVTGDREKVEKLLAAEIVRNPRSVFPQDAEFEQFRIRTLLLHARWPDFPDLREGSSWWVENADSLVGGCRSLQDVRKNDLARSVIRTLNGRQRQMLETVVPERLEVPTGSRIRLKYQEEGPPILAVKLQELFGCVDSPSIFKGEVKVLIHLLSPAGRPLQITQDLRSFWLTTYPALRKEMRGQYPRHPWPEDPFTAPPQRGVTKKPRK